jgi:hypothetical protein
MSQVIFVEYENLTQQQRDAVQYLKSVVYPPDAFLQRLKLWFMRRLGKMGRRYTWASPQWLVLLTEGDELITGVGINVREIISNGASKRIGGIGGVMTHPARRNEGLASWAMQEAAHRLHDELQVAFALLFCRPHLVPFYKRLKWKSFEGKVLAYQPEGKIDFMSKGPMVLDVREQAPLGGTLDLNGLPW